MLYLIAFQINQHISFQYHMIKYQIYIIMSAGYTETVLLSNESKSPTEQKLSQITYKRFFKIVFIIMINVWQSGKLQHKGVEDDVFRLLHLIPTFRKFQHPFLVFA